MKKITLIILGLVGFGLLLSCEKKEAEPVLDMNQATAPAMTEPASGSAYILIKDQADSTITTFKWNAAEYSLDNLEAVTYHLEMDWADSNFTGARDIVSTQNTEYAILVSELNDNVLAMGAEPDVIANFEVRLFAYLNTDTDYSDLYSDKVTISVTPYEEIITAPSLWVPGDYQGWDPASAPRIYDHDNDGIFTGYIYMPEGGTYEFKFTSAPDWDNINYGYGGEGLLDTDPGAGNLSVPAPGGYAVTVDINNLEWTYVLENWGVIGEWTAWEDDIDMEWDAENEYLIKTVENIPAAENQRFKFRANDSWDVNLGAKDPDDGTLIPGGADIPIPEGGTITFILNFTTALPTYEVIK